VSFTISGQRELNRRLTAIGDAPRGMLRDVGLHAVHEAQALVPVRTGNLRRTIRMGALTDTYVEIRAGGQRDIGYAASVEFGSAAHVIVPRNRKVLAWGGARTLGGRLRKGSSATNFARRVNHPGTKAHPYMVPGMNKALEIVGITGIVKAWNGAA
jgi:hypothetical protein